MSAQAQIDESRSPRAVVVAPIANTNRRQDPDRKVDPRIYNRRFGKALRFLFALQQTASQHIKLNKSTNIHLERLNRINIISFPHRWLTFWREYSAPKDSDWILVETKITNFISVLTEQEIKGVELKHISNEMLSKWALGLLLASIASLWASSFAGRPSLLFLCFIIWLAATGALGTAAFVYVNALSIQTDPNVVVTSRTFVKLRLILGALFAVIISLPFYLPIFFEFEHKLRTMTDTPESVHRTLSNIDINSFLFILPFVFGFSTPLVLCILSRLVESVCALFLGLGPATAQAERTPRSNKQRTPSAHPRTSRGSRTPRQRRALKGL